MICKTCEEEKSVDDFYKAKNTKSGYRGSCKQCVNDQNNTWYDQNKEEFNATTRKRYREEHRAEATERMRRWRETNPEKAREIARKSYIDNKESVSERSKTFYSSRVGYSAWKRARRVERIKDNGGTFTMQELKDLFDLFGNQCINPDCEGTDERLSVDHVIPIARGGQNNIENIQPLCLTCNLRKGTQIIDYREVSNDSEVQHSG